VSQENLETAKNLTRLFNEGEPDAFYECIAEDVYGEDLNAPPDVSGVFEGRGALRKYIAGWDDVFDDFVAEVDEYIAEGDYVVSVLRWIGTAKGSGARVEWRGADAYRFQDGIVVWWTSGYPDKQTALDAVRQRAASAVE
jgi:ketosteroid isomerase-like protein